MLYMNLTIGSPVTSKYFKHIIEPNRRDEFF